MSSSPTPTTQEADPLSSTVPAPLMSELKVTLIGALLIAVGPVSMVLYTPALPDIVRYFGTTGAMVQMTVTLYFRGFAATSRSWGPTSDASGRRPVILTF